MFGPPYYTAPPEDPADAYSDHIDGWGRGELAAELNSVETELRWPAEEWSNRTLDSLRSCRAVLLEALAGFKDEEEDDDESSVDP